jgi:hypothetical protein
MMATIKDQSTTRQHQPTENETNKKEENPLQLVRGNQITHGQKEEEKSTGDLASCLFRQHAPLNEETATH